MPTISEELVNNVGAAVLRKMPVSEELLRTAVSHYTHPQSPVSRSRPIEIFCLSCGMTHTLNVDQIERVVYTLQGMMQTLALDDASERGDEEPYECLLKLLTFSHDSEMYAEHCDETVEARGQKPRDDDYIERIHRPTKTRENR